MEKRDFYTAKDARFAFFLAVIAPNVLGIIASFIIIGAGIEDYSSNPAIMVVLAGLGQVAFISIYLLYNQLMGIRQFKAANLSFKISLRNFLLASFLGFVCIFGFNFIIEFFMQALYALGYKSSGTPLPLDNVWWLLANILLLGILPAVCEELVFRGIILNGFLSKYKVVTAIILSSLLFAIMHGNLEQLIFPFLMGLVFGYVFYKTGSIVYTIILHFINNLIAIIINYIYVNTGVGSFEMPLGLTFIIGMQLLAITVLIIFLLDKFWEKPQKPLQIVQQEGNNEGKELFWIGIAVCALFLILSIFM